jgi:hypothetical protein
MITAAQLSSRTSFHHEDREEHEDRMAWGKGQTPWARFVPVHSVFWIERDRVLSVSSCYVLTVSVR